MKKFGEDLQVQMAEAYHRIAELEDRLADAEETLRAIGDGEVDALVVSGKVFTLKGADHPYRVLVEEMHEGTVSLDLDGLILYSNRQFASMMRTGVEGVLGSTIHRFVTADQQEMFAALLEASTHGPSRGELNLRAADGCVIPTQVSLNRLDSGSMQNVCAVITDLTERFRNEAIIKEEQLSRLILDQAAEAIVVIDTTGKILRASESAQRIAGRPVLLNDFDTMFPLWADAPDRREPFNTSKIIQAASLGTDLRGIEMSLKRPDAVSCALLMSTGPLWDNRHQLLGCVVTLTDISDRKRSEEALRRQSNELARSNNDLRQFAYSASHDLQEPLRVLAIYSQLLHRKYAGRLDAEADRFIGFIVEAADRMQVMVRDLLSYTQAADGAEILAIAVDANAVLSKVKASLEMNLVEHKGSIRSDALPKLRVHEVHLQQLLQNLISNALKYQKPGVPPSIAVSAERNGELWKIAIADNGIGIPQEYRKQVFGLFKRLHGGGHYSGNGIGLAICQKIVERYGGQIWVESEPGIGSTFYFTLPGDPEV